jgi:hypothetical protein
LEGGSVIVLADIETEEGQITVERSDYGWTFIGQEDAWIAIPNAKLAELSKAIADAIWD